MAFTILLRHMEAHRRVTQFQNFLRPMTVPQTEVSLDPSKPVVRKFGELDRRGRQPKLRPLANLSPCTPKVFIVSALVLM